MSIAKGKTSGRCFVEYWWKRRCRAGVSLSIGGRREDIKSVLIVHCCKGRRRAGVSIEYAVTNDDCKLPTVNRVVVVAVRTGWRYC